MKSCDNYLLACSAAVLANAALIVLFCREITLYVLFAFSHICCYAFRRQANLFVCTFRDGQRCIRQLHCFLVCICRTVSWLWTVGSRACMLQTWVSVCLIKTDYR